MKILCKYWRDEDYYEVCAAAYKKCVCCADVQRCDYPQARRIKDEERIKIAFERLN
jgi:hypothetical protein